MCDVWTNGGLMTSPVAEAEVDVQTWGIKLSTVTPKRLSWMSKGRLAHGKMTDLAGDAGQGKTMVLLDWCARYSRGGGLPDGVPDEKRHVIYMSVEDDVEDTLVPRLMIAGADLTYIHVVYRNPATGQFFHFPDDVEVLGEMIDAWNTGLIVIDPMQGFMAPGKTVNNGEDVRYCYQPLVDAIKRPGVGVITVRHHTKQISVTNAAYRGAGSMQITAVVRAGLTVARSQKNPRQRVLAQNKENLTERMPSLLFELQSVSGEDHPRVEWLGETDEGADELLMDPRERGELNRAREWIRSALTDGPKLGRELLTAWREEGGSDRTLRDAANSMNVDYRRDGFGQGSRVEWALPKLPYGLSWTASAGTGLSEDFPEE